MRVLSHTSLEVLEVSDDDAGEYVCMVDVLGETVSQSHKITIAGKDNYDSHSNHSSLLTVPPRITSCPTIISLLAGEDMQMLCKAEGSPQPEVKWRKDGHSWEGGSGESEAVLVITGVTRTDVGLYTCQAENGVGSLAWQTTRVLVRCKY